MTTRVYLNPGATYGTGQERWKGVQSALAERLGTFAVEELPPQGREATGALRRSLGTALERGVRRFVAAGGDGTVNLLVNALMSLPDTTGIALGAVGLGSSNDFHKPFDADATVDGMPLSVDFEQASPRDVIRIDHSERGVGESVRYAIVNASIGVTAEANAAFNEPNALVRAARTLSMDAAISAAVLTTLLTYRNIDCALATDDARAETVSVTNISAFKNPHFGGTLCYDTEVGRDDGLLGVALCEGMNRLETMRTLSALRRCSFTGRKGTRSWKASRLTVEAARSFALETDGETVRADSAAFRISERKIACCR